MTVPEMVSPKIPEGLTRATADPDCDIEVNGDLVDCVRDYRRALGQANADKAAIRSALQGAGE